MAKKEDALNFIGKRFGRFTILEDLGCDVHRMVLCKCDCGNIKRVSLPSLKNGDSKSCGCLHKELKPTFNFKHGLIRHSLYTVWNKMKDRCYKETDRSYKNYGGRGVTICSEWLLDFMSFYNWAIANGWQKGLELDKDILYAKKHGTKVGMIYSPEYCSFVTQKENAGQKSNSRILYFNGVGKSTTEWCRELNLNVKRVENRLKLGWSVEDAFEKRVRGEELFEYKGEKKTLVEWCKALGLPYPAMTGRVRQMGWPIEVAFNTPLKKRSI